MKALSPNTLLQNRYLIVHLIGKGGMGEVYLAVDQRLGSAVALKRTLHGEDAALGEAFEREARTLARLRHPALPKVSDHFIENGNQFLVMEHISGEDLAKRLTATQKPFPLNWVLFWADQLLNALDYLHSHEPPIVHRDIKPQNLKLTDNNSIVLLDFGLSKNSTGQTNVTSGTGSTGSVVGYTPHYAPMEQIRGTGTNPRSDIYSLSATLYQLLTNVVPPDALSRADFLLSGKADPLVPINEINQEIPKAISDVIIKGMSISQDHRFTDARQMQQVLRETYARMQNQMAEKTIAFNAQEEVPEAAPASQTSGSSNDKTEQFSMPVAENADALKEAMGAKTIPFGMVDGDALAENLPPVSYSADKTEQIQNFDATMRVDSEPDKDSPAQDFGVKTEVLPVADAVPPKQANIRTEVMGGDFGAAEYFRQTDDAPQNQENGDKEAKHEDKFGAPSLTGDKTVPLIGFDNQKAPVDLAQTLPASAFDSAPSPESFATQVETPTNNNFAPANGGQVFTPPTPNYDSQPKQSPPVIQPSAEKKKSKGVLFAVLGALFGLVILAAAGGGIAYYVMNQPGTTEATTSPTPLPLPSATATPEATPEQALTNAEPANSTTANSETVNNNSNFNSPANAAPSPAPTRTVTTQQPTPVVQTTRPVNTPKPVTNTPKPATPRPTPETRPSLRGREIPQ
jgi:serine/threonine protein kinase